MIPMRDFMTTVETAKMAHTAMRFTETVTTRWNARLAGSKACLACADYLKEVLETFCDRTEQQDFSVRPGAFLGYIRINVGLYFLSLFALLFRYFDVAATLATLAVVITVLEFFFYKEFVDGLYPKRIGRNVFGTIEPEKEVKQQIIFSAHHDSAHIFHFLETNPITYARKIVSATLAQLGMLLMSWYLLLAQVFDFQHPTVYWGLLGILALAGIMVGQLWFFYRKEGTPGAGDNMICTALAIEIGKYFARQKSTGNGLQHTRIMIASWDAEECGLRGARAYTQMYQADLQAIKTYNFNLECMYDHEYMTFLLSDLNNFVSLSASMAEECQQVSEQLGFQVGTEKFPFLAGGTDAAEFAKIGVEATTLAAMNWAEREKDTAYHTTRDTIEAVDEVAVERSIHIGILYAKKKDQGLGA